jgi:hypothetical protein
VKRREFITLLGGAAAMWPLAARAQQARMPVIGVLWPGTSPPGYPRMESFTQALRQLSFIEGQNLAIELRYAREGLQQLPELAAELVLANVDVLATFGDLTPKIAQQATGTKRTSQDVGQFVRFSNRPSGSSAFRLSTNSNVDVAHGLALLSGLGTKALPSWDSKTRWNNLSGGLAVTRTAGPSGQTISPHPSSREGHHSTVGVEFDLLLSHLILHSLKLLRAP